MSKELMTKNNLVAGEGNFDTRQVVNTLEGLMTKVTSKECSATTVHAACNCAEKITNILKVHLDLFRLNLEVKKYEK